MFYMMNIPVYNGFMMIVYSAVFTVLPVFSVIYAEDIDWKGL